MPWTRESINKAKGERYANYHTAGELARKLGVHKITVLRRIEQGKLIPDATNEMGWHLFSPEQVRSILRNRAEGKW
jgi:hypothetical protein